MNRSVGMLVVGGGIFLVLLGLVIYSGGLNWFGHLPGDIRYEGERTAVYIPIVSMLIISLVLTIILNLLRRFL